MKVDTFHKYKELIKLIIEIKYKKAIIKQICNNLNDLGITTAQKYDHKGSFSCYQVMRNIYKNFLDHGMAGIFNLKTICMSKDNFDKKDWDDKRKKVRDSLTDRQKDELIDIYEEILEIDSNDEKFKRIYEIYKKEKDDKNCIQINDLLTLLCLNEKTFEIGKQVCEQHVKDLDLRTANSPKSPIIKNDADFVQESC